MKLHPSKTSRAFPLLSRQWRTLICYVPALLLLGVFFFYPLLHVLLLSVGAPHLTGSLYAAFFSDSVYLLVTGRTLLITVSVTLITLIVGYPTAAFLASVSERKQRLLLVCVVIPYLTSLLVRTYAWVIILGDQGPVNNLLLSTGLIDTPLPLLYSRFGMLLGMVHVMLPMMVLPLYASMRQIDRSLLRAASSLGGGALRNFWRIYFPQTSPGMRSGCTLVFIVSLGFYIIPMALGGLGDVMLSSMIAQQVTTAGNFGMASVMAFALLCLAALAFLALRLSQYCFAAASALARVRAARSGPSTVSKASCALSGWMWTRKLNQTRSSTSPGSWTIAAIGLATLVFLILPSLVVLVVSFGRDDMLTFPPSGFSLRWYDAFFQSGEWLKPTWLSARVAVLSTVIALVAGALASFALARSKSSKLTSIGQGVLLVPLVIPPVVFAIGAFSVLSNWSLVGSTAALVVEHACLCLPMVVVVMLGAFAAFDTRLERASLSLGHSRFSTFWRIVLPLILPALFSAALFAFITSFDEVVVTSFIAGNEVKTLPLKMFEDVRNQVDPTIAAVSAMLIAVPFFCLPFFAVGSRKTAGTRFKLLPRWRRSLHSSVPNRKMP